MGKYVNKDNADFAEARGHAYLDITSFITGVSDRDRIVDEMVARVIADIKGEFPDVRHSEWGTLMDVLLVGVNYDKKSKRHECRIERWGESPSLHQTTDQVLRLLSVMDGEMSSGEMMRKLGLRHLPTFRTMYREPALSLGLIAMTKPEKHTSPTQKYYLTEKGKKLLDL